MKILSAKTNSARTLTPRTEHDSVDSPLHMRTAYHDNEKQIHIEFESKDGRDVTIILSNKDAQKITKYLLENLVIPAITPSRTPE